MNVKLLFILLFFALTNTIIAAKKPEILPVDSLYIVWEKGKINYIDYSGKLVLQTQYDQAGVFSEGYAPVISNNMMGFIDTNGQLVFEARYKYVNSYFEELEPAFNDGLAKVHINGNNCRYINKKGKYATLFTYAQASSYSDGIAYMEFGSEGYFYINKLGVRLLPLSNYSSWSRYSEGLFAVRSGSSDYQYLNKLGVTELSVNSKYASYFTEGLAAVEKDGKLGYINKQGAFVIEPKFDYPDYYHLSTIQAFSDGLACVRLDGKWGYCDHKGNIVIKPQYDRVFSFRNGLALVTYKNAEERCVFSYINKDGKIIYTGFLPYDINCK